jgi:hypothetical protein
MFLSAAAIAVGVTVVPWITGSNALGAERTQSLWTVIDHADTDGSGIADTIAFGQFSGGAWLQVVGSLVIAGFLVLFGLVEQEAKDVRLLAAACVVGGVVAAYIAWRISDAIEIVNDLVGPLGDANLGPGGLITVGGFIAGAIGCAWRVSTPPERFHA